MNAARTDPRAAEVVDARFPGSGTGHLDPDVRAMLAAAAAFERSAREKHLPALVSRGDVTECDAQSEYQAWCAVALWTAGEPINFDIDFASMAFATARGLQRLEALVEAEPDNKALIGRREAIQDIHAMVSDHRDWLADLNRRLRDRAQREREAQAA